jgi:membrane protein implicated in regulation of membrane protease activity
MVLVLILLLVVIAAAVVVLFVPGALDLAPFLIAAIAYAVVGLRSIFTKNEELSDLKQEQARITGGPTA